jgi:hypothetical protein
MLRQRSASRLPRPGSGGGGGGAGARGRTWMEQALFGEAPAADAPRSLGSSVSSLPAAAATGGSAGSKRSSAKRSVWLDGPAPPSRALTNGVAGLASQLRQAVRAAHDSRPVAPRRECSRPRGRCRKDGSWRRSAPRRDPQRCPPSEPLARTHTCTRASSRMADIRLLASPCVCCAPRRAQREGERSAGRARILRQDARGAGAHRVGPHRARGQTYARTPGAPARPPARRPACSSARRAP